MKVWTRILLVQHAGAAAVVSGQLYIPTNFVDSRVLTNGPIRVMFELVYEPFDVNGVK